jgi:hypothetical protein
VESGLRVATAKVMHLSDAMLFTATRETRKWLRMGSPPHTWQGSSTAAVNADPAEPWGARSAILIVMRWARAQITNVP